MTTLMDNKPVMSARVTGQSAKTQVSSATTTQGKVMAKDERVEGTSERSVAAINLITL